MSLSGLVTRAQVTYARGALAGAAFMWSLLYLTGYAPLWFGPERRLWYRALEDDPDGRIKLEEFENDPELWRYRLRASSRNFLEVHSSTAERRISKALFLDKSMKRLKGLIKFGPDVEGPPQCVHGGCSAAVIDGCLGTLAQHASLVPCLTANLTINYREKIPLGSCVGIECWHDRTEGRKVHLFFKVYNLSGSTNTSNVYIEGNALFLRVGTSFLTA